MTTVTKSFSEWQSYAQTLDPVHVSWLKQAKPQKQNLLLPILLAWKYHTIDS